MPSDYRTERVDPTLRVLDHPSGHDGAARRHLPPHAYEGQPRPPHHPPAVDVASMLGLPVDAVTPALLAAVAPLLGELDRLRWTAEQAEHRAHWLEQQSDRHSVVPCLNRRAFMRELDTFLVGGDCLGTVAVVHVDGVEGLCRLFGLAAGEGAMRHIAATILGALRSSDVVGCLSGSDFALLLPGTSAEQARAKLDSICQRMVEPPFTWMGNEVALQPECGMHALGVGDSAESAIAAADLARRGLS
jgi:GGDEF domain-containing protein